jgi:hypothetical protein
MESYVYGLLVPLWAVAKGKRSKGRMLGKALGIVRLTGQNVVLKGYPVGQLDKCAYLVIEVRPIDMWDADHRFPFVVAPNGPVDTGFPGIPIRVNLAEILISLLVQVR